MVIGLHFVFCGALATASAESSEPTGLDLVCPLVEHERQRELEDSQIERELVEHEYRARVEIFEMIEKLWAVRSVEREIYLDSKRKRDRTKVSIARLTTQIAQQESILAQYRLSCSQVRGEAVPDISERIQELQAEYRRLDCELLARDAEIAKVDYAFDKAMLDATRTLAEGNIKSRYDLVIDEFDLRHSKARLESYTRRTKTCRQKLSDRSGRAPESE